MLQFMLDFEKDSEAEAKMATSRAPTATAASKPYKSRNLESTKLQHI